MNIVLSVMLAILTLAQIAASEPVEIGWVEWFQGSSRDYRLVRAGLPLPVRVFTPIFYGDEITVLVPSGRLDVLLADGRKLQVAPGGAMHVSTTVNTKSSVSGNVLRWAQELFTRWHEDVIAPAQIALRTRERFSIPILAAGGGFLRAGDRPLFLAWTGGVAPFSVQIRRLTGDSLLLTLDRIQERSVLTPALSLRPGQYELALRDAGNGAFIAQLTVFEQLPTLPAALESEDLPPPVRDTLRAAWFASLDEPRWAFEGFQLVTTTASGNYYPALLLRDSLAAGDRPLPPAESQVPRRELGR